MSDSFFKIALYADSLGLPRQNKVKYEERYLYLVQEKLQESLGLRKIEIKDRAKGAATIEDLYTQFCHDNSYYDLPGDLLILQTGIVECAPRPVNEKTRKIISKLPIWLRERVIKFIHNNRRKLIERNLGLVRMDKNKFQNLYSEFLNYASKLYKNIFVISICPTNPAFEKRSPGFTNNINKYNEVIQTEISKLAAENVFYININKTIMLDYANIDKYILKEDGHHITPMTHAIIATQIIEVLEKK
jgi:acyl-CoA thioesterase-1